eukprot:Gb_15629 [translate_table: standard]
MSSMFISSIFGDLSLFDSPEPLWTTSPTTSRPCSCSVSNSYSLRSGDSEPSPLEYGFPGACIHCFFSLPKFLFDSPPAATIRTEMPKTRDCSRKMPRISNKSIYEGFSFFKAFFANISISAFQASASVANITFILNST